MSMGDENKVVSPEDLPKKNSNADEEKSIEDKTDLPPTRIVDDKLIGDDRDLQDAMEKKEPEERDPARDNNY